MKLRSAIAAAIAPALLLLPGVAHANTLNVSAGEVESGSILYTSPEPIAGLCSWFNSWRLVAPVTGSFVSLGGAEYTGDYSITAAGTTECITVSAERGLVSSATISGQSGNLGSTLSCTPLNGSYVREAGSLVLTLAGPCAVNGATVVGSTTFQLTGTWKPWVTVDTTNPAAVTGFSGLDLTGAVTVTPDASVGLGVGPPVVTQIDPAQGTTLGGTSVQIHGAGFADGLGSRVHSVTFGSRAATAYTVVNDNLIIATTPAAPAGAVTVQVTTDGGSSATTPTYTYLPPPVVAGVSPSSGGDGQAMTIFGSGFFGGQSSDQVQDIALVCSACAGATAYPYCWSTVSDTEIDISSYCAATPGYDGFRNKTVFDVVVTTDVASSQISAADHWTYVKGQALAGPVTWPILLQ